MSNREPWIHDFSADGSIAVRHSPGGVSVALDAMMRERGGVWIAHGSGTADSVVVDARDSIDVPPGSPAYRLRRVWLTREEVERYYAGFANSGDWAASPSWRSAVGARTRIVVDPPTPVSTRTS